MSDDPSARTGRAGPVLRGDAARNRARLLAAARQQVTEGDRTLALNGLARCAGVGVGTAYRHFPDRQTLIEGLAEATLAELVTQAQRAADDPDPSAGLERLLHAALRGIADDPALAEVLQAPEPACVETIGLSEELGVALGELLRRAREAGAVTARCTPDDLRRLLVGVHAAATAGADPEGSGPRYLAVLLAGLGATPVLNGAPPRVRSLRGRSS